jgi:hypothetical protein
MNATVNAVKTANAKIANVENSPINSGMYCMREKNF